MHICVNFYRLFLIELEVGNVRGEPSISLEIIAQAQKHQKNISYDVSQMRRLNLATLREI